MNASFSYDLALVILSILIVVAASYTALDLASRVAQTSGMVKRAWLGAAALVLGGGIWAMHFIAMLALHVGIPISYDFSLTALSFFIAVACTGIALYAAGLWGYSLGGLLLSGIFMGLGIVAMHYTGMAAIRLPGAISTDMTYGGAAIVLAISASTVAIWLAYRRHSIGQRLVAACALGAGIAGMHYVAMAGVTFDVQAGGGVPHEEGIASFHLAIAVTAATGAIVVAALLAAIYDRRFAHLAERETAMWRESEERFRLLYRRTPLPLHSLDRNGCIEQVSDRWLDLIGYRREEVIGRPLTDFMTADSARLRKEEHWPRLLNSGELRDAEYRLVTHDGRRLDCVLSAVAEWDKEGRLSKTLCGLIDVTDRRAAEQALRQAQKLEAVGQLTGGIAHDFNNLLAVVLGNLELASKRAPDDPRLRSLLDNAAQAAQRGASLTQRMLAFARRQDLNPEPVNIPDLVLGMAELLRRSIGPSIRIETRFPLGLPRARVDANQLELALLNLAVNARDAMPEGGSIVISAHEQMIGHQDADAGEARLPAGRYFCLSLTDNGSGMDEETLAHATEPFFTTKGVGKGTGLGLAMVHGLAAQSGGRLTLESRAGQGTTATICLPVAEEVVRPAPVAEITLGVEAETSDAPSEKAAQRVLVVDDDPLVLSATAAMLEDLDYIVTEASSAQEGLRILEAGAEFDAVLTDQAMPGMTGVQLAAVIAARWPGVPVVLGTGYAELPPDARADMMRLGKPFSREGLRRAMVTAMGGARDNVVPLTRHG